MDRSRSPRGHVRGGQGGKCGQGQPGAVAVGEVRSSTFVHPKGRPDRRPFGLHTLRLMNHCRTSAQVRLHGRRVRSTALTRLTGMAILLMAATIWPMAVFAADPAVETQDNAIVVFTVLVLLFGSVTAGLFFASPLRRRISGDPQERRPKAPADDAFGFDTDLQRRAQHLLQPLEQSTAAAVAAPVPPPAQLVIQAPSADQTPLDVQVAVTTQPPPSQVSPAVHSPTAQATQAPGEPSSAAQAATAVQSPAVSPHRLVASPWSTSLPQPDANWTPGRRRAP